MRRAAVIGAVCACALAWASPGWRPGRRRARGSPRSRSRCARTTSTPGPWTGCSGPLTKRGRCGRFSGGRASGRAAASGRRHGARSGTLGRPLLGERELWIGHVGWDVSSLEFRLRRLGLRPGKVDGRFTNATERALRRFQRNSGLRRTASSGRFTIRALAHAARSTPRPLPCTWWPRARASSRSRSATT